MKPCDCKDMVDSSKLYEQGLTFNHFSILLKPPNVNIEATECTFKINQKVFTRFAKWYLEDQKETT